MPGTPSSARWGGAASLAVLLVLTAACSSATSAEPSPSPTPAASPGLTATGPSSIAAPSTGASATTAGRPSSTEPAPTATPPTPGGITSTVEARPEPSKKPVKLDQPSTTGTGITARLVSIDEIQAKAEVPGEVAGPALAITVEVRNTGSKTVDLGAVAVTLADADLAPGGEMTSDPAKPLRGSVKPGKAARGVYVFTVPSDKRDPVTLTVSIGEAPVLVFTGSAR